MRDDGIITFSHRYKGQDWHCIPISRDMIWYELYEILDQLRDVVGRRGHHWRFQLVMPNRSIRTLLSLLDVGGQHADGSRECIMLADQSHVKIVEDLLQG